MSAESTLHAPPRFGLFGRKPSEWLIGLPTIIVSGAICGWIIARIALRAMRHMKDDRPVGRIDRRARVALDMLVQRHQIADQVCRLDPRRGQ